MLKIDSRLASAHMAAMKGDYIKHEGLTGQGLERLAFDPNKHLARGMPLGCLSMQDLGYAADLGVSPMAVSQPFQLFTPEAIQKMRAEISTPAVLESYMFSSNLAQSQLRGYAKEHAPFTYQAWRHPETLSMISRIAQVDLIPVMDYEIGHINLSIKTNEQTRAELNLIEQQKRLATEDEGIGGCTMEDARAIVGWHKDSYPFVCVLMMSDCTNMLGGETAIRAADGHVVKIRGPAQGCAVVMQGKYLLHQAEQAFGVRERITSVTSFRPRSALLKDDSVLRTVRPVSNLSELYYDFAEYRLEILEARVKEARKAMTNLRKSETSFDTSLHNCSINAVADLAARTTRELVSTDMVQGGVLEEA